MWPELGTYPGVALKMVRVKKGVYSWSSCQYRILALHQTLQDNYYWASEMNTHEELNDWTAVGDENQKIQMTNEIWKLTLKF